MPGPQKTKGTLKNTRFKSKMRRHNTTQRRRQAFHLQKLDETQRQEYLALVARLGLLIARKLEREGKIHPVQNCDGSFEVYYDNDDAWKITNEIFKTAVADARAQATAERTFHRATRGRPRNQLSLTFILFFVAATMVQKTDAKWYEFSSPPGELSALDVSSAIALGGGMTLMAAGSITANPALFLVGSEMASCGQLIGMGASGKRLYNSATGTYPLNEVDTAAEFANMLTPGLGKMGRLFHAVESGKPSARFMPKLGINALTENQDKTLSFVIDTALPAGYGAHQYLTSKGPIASMTKSNAKAVIDYLEPRLPASVTGRV